jgi:poly(3-hydroxybutyrate) depolymerase
MSIDIALDLAWRGQAAFAPHALTHAGMAMSALTRSLGAPAPQSAWQVTVTDRGGGERPVSIESVYESPFQQVIRFLPDDAKVDRPPVLLVAPISGHHPSVLSDTVSVLLPEYDVHATEWRDAADIPSAAGRFGLAEFHAEILAALGAIGPNAAVMGVSQSVPAVLAITALLAEREDRLTPQAIILLAGPIDARVAETLPGALARLSPPGLMEAPLLRMVGPGRPGAGRLVYPGETHLAALSAMKPTRMAWAQLAALTGLLVGPDAPEARDLMERGEVQNLLDVPAELFVETLDAVFRRHLLAKGALDLDGRVIRPEAIRDTWLMTVEGEDDTAAPPGQTSAAHLLCPAIPAERRRAIVAPRTAHFGVFRGPSWRERIGPEVKAFLDLSMAVSSR